MSHLGLCNVLGEDFDLGRELLFEEQEFFQ